MTKILTLFLDPPSQDSIIPQGSSLRLTMNMSILIGVELKLCSEIQNTSFWYTSVFAHLENSPFLFHPRTTTKKTKR